MKMTPGLSQLQSLVGLFLALHLGAASSGPPGGVVDTYDSTGLTNATKPASQAHWKNTTATSAVLRRSNQSMSATTASPDSKQNSVITTVSHNNAQNGTVATTSGWNGTFATTGSVHTSTTRDPQVRTESELSAGTTASPPVTKATTATTPPINVASLSVATLKATNPPSTPTTQAVTVPGILSHRDNPELASTAQPNKTLSTTLGAPFNLEHSKKTMTIIFSSLFGVAALVILLYILDRCKQKKTQYLHRPLYNNSEETVDRFMPADDTLVISGGLYDGPRIYNPTMTTANEDEDFHCDQPPFPARSTQFQLKLLKEGDKPPSYEASTCQSSQCMEQNA